MARIACFGEMLLRLSPSGAERLGGTSTLDLFVGGAEANVAAGLAQLGHDVRMISALPDNALGEQARRTLEARGVETSYLRNAEGRMGLYFAEGFGTSDRGQVIYDRADSAFARAMASDFGFAEALDNVDMLVLGGITPALGPHTAATALELGREARRQGCKLVFDCNYRETLWKSDPRDPAEVLAPIIECADILFAGPRDAAYLAGFAGGENEARAAAEAIMARFPRLDAILSTRRERGEVTARLDRGDSESEAGPIEVAEAVGRIGSGDAFASGVLHGLLEGVEDTLALELGLAALSLKHSVAGDMPEHDLAALRSCAVELFAR